MVMFSLPWYITSSLRCTWGRVTFCHTPVVSLLCCVTVLHCPHEWNHIPRATNSPLNKKRNSNSRPDVYTSKVRWVEMVLKDSWSSYRWLWPELWDRRRRRRLVSCDGALEKTPRWSRSSPQSLGRTASCEERPRCRRWVCPSQD